MQCDKGTEELGIVNRSMKTAGNRQKVPKAEKRYTLAPELTLRLHLAPTQASPIAEL